MKQRNDYKYDEKFIQTTGAGGDLYALDMEGRVWKYFPSVPATPSTKLKYAFWGLVTAFRALPDKNITQQQREAAAAMDE